MATPDPIILPRTRSVSPFRLGTPPQRDFSAAPPDSSASGDFYEPSSPHTQLPTGTTHFKMPSEARRTSRGRHRTRADDLPPFASSGTGRSATPQASRAERVKSAGQELIGTSAFALAVGAWLVAGTPLILTAIVAWLGYIVASAAFDFAVSIYLD